MNAKMLMNAVVSHVKTLVSTHRGLIIVLVKVDTGSCPTDNVKTSTNAVKENTAALILVKTLKEATVASVQLDIHWVQTGLHAMISMSVKEIAVSALMASALTLMDHIPAHVRMVT